MISESLAGVLSSFSNTKLSHVNFGSQVSGYLLLFQCLELPSRCLFRIGYLTNSQNIAVPITTPIKLPMMANATSYPSKFDSKKYLSFFNAFIFAPSLICRVVVTTLQTDSFDGLLQKSRL